MLLFVSCKSIWLIIMILNSLKLWIIALLHPIANWSANAALVVSGARRVTHGANRRSNDMGTSLSLHTPAGMNDCVISTPNPATSTPPQLASRNHAHLHLLISIRKRIWRQRLVTRPQSRRRPLEDARGRVSSDEGVEWIIGKLLKSKWPRYVHSFMVSTSNVHAKPSLVSSSSRNAVL